MEHYEEGATPLLTRFGISPLTGARSTRPLRRPDTDFILVAAVVHAVSRAGIPDVLKYSAELLGLPWERVRYRRDQARKRVLLDRNELTESGWRVLREELGVLAQQSCQ